MTDERGPPAPDGSVLAAVTIFEGLSPGELNAVAGRCRWRRFARGQQIVRVEDDTIDVYFVVAGTARAEVHSSSGRAVTFRDLGPGEMFGELAAIDGGRRSADVVALTDVTIASVSAEAFREIFVQFPTVAEATLRRLVTLVRSLSDRVVEFSTLAVRNRIHAELLRLSRDHRTADNVAAIDPAPTHAEIASRVSTHREAVSRELSDLARRGIVERRDGGLIVPDIERLSRLVGEAVEE
jgi:CRP-like cAMP-binding protein